MKLCLVSPPRRPAEQGAACFEQLAELLAGEHEVTLVRVDERGGRSSPEPAGERPRYREVRAEPQPEMTRTVFAGDAHRLSAAVMEAIEAAFDRQGPDYVEVADRHAHGLVPLMARRCGNPLFSRTLFGVRLLGSAELESLHNGALGEPDMRLLGELEREQLRLADRLIWPGGDALDLYGRYYGELPEATRIGQPFMPADPPPTPKPRASGEPLRILYVGGLRRCDGALDLAEACLRLPVDGWRLTMIGADTATAPAGQSVELTLGEMLGADPRLTIEGPPAAADLGRAFRAHDLLVVPPTFAVWPRVALAAMRAGLPVLATPVGGLVEIIADGVTGWLTGDSGPGAIRESLLRLLDDRAALERVRSSGEIYERFLALTDPGPILSGYEDLLKAGAASSAPRRRRPAGGEEPLVSGVVPYYRGSAFVEEAVSSLLGQTHRRIEAVVVNDGSFEPSDGVLERLAADPRVRVVTQLNRGETSARNLGARMARGEYLVMLDADNVLEPRFVARALEVLDREPGLAYVSCWLRFIGADGSLLAEPAGYAALGNRVVRDDTNNWDGDTLALLPRRIFTELSLRFDPSAVIYSDWELYRALREAGLYGVVIPERLARYRMLSSSLQRAHGIELQRRGWEEARERRLLRSTRWTAEV